MHNLAPVDEALDVPTKALADEVAISATAPSGAELWVDTSAVSRDLVTREEFDGVLARLAALETMVGGGA